MEHYKNLNRELAIVNYELKNTINELKTELKNLHSKLAEKNEELINKKKEMEYLKQKVFRKCHELLNIFDEKSGRYSSNCKPCLPFQSENVKEVRTNYGNTSITRRETFMLRRSSSRSPCASENTSEQELSKALDSLKNSNGAGKLDGAPDCFDNAEEDLDNYTGSYKNACSNLADGSVFNIEKEDEDSEGKSRKTRQILSTVFEESTIESPIKVTRLWRKRQSQNRSHYLDTSIKSKISYSENVFKDEKLLSNTNNSDNSINFTALNLQYDPSSTPLKINKSGKLKLKNSIVKIRRLKKKDLRILTKKANEHNNKIVLKENNVKNEHKATKQQVGENKIEERYNNVMQRPKRKVAPSSFKEISINAKQRYDPKKNIALVRI